MGLIQMVEVIVSSQIKIVILFLSKKSREKARGEREGLENTDLRRREEKLSMFPSWPFLSPDVAAICAMLFFDRDCKEQDGERKIGRVALLRTASHPRSVSPSLSSCSFNWSSPLSASLPKPLGFAPPRKRGRSPSPNGNSSFKGPRESYDLPRSSTSSGMPPSRSRDYDYDYDYSYEYDYDSRAPVRSYRGRSRGPPDDYEVYPTGKDGYRPPSKIRPAGDRDGRYGPREYERERERDRYEDHYRRDGYDYDYAYGRDYESGGYGRDYRGGERRSREYYDDGHGYDYSSEYDYGYGHDYGYEDDWGGRGGEFRFRFWSC